MLSPDLKNFLAPMVRTMTIIWGAMMAASIFYVFIAWFIFGPAEQTVADAEAGQPGPIAPILGVVAFLVIVASIILERWWFSGPRIMAKLAETPAYERLVAGQNTGNPSRDQFESLPESEQELACLVPYYQTGMIIIWAMRESVAVLGLVGAIVTSDFMVVVPFGVGALAFLAIKMPRPVAFLKQVRRLPGAAA